MKLLYYSTSYYADHGGSIQSKAFYQHLDQFDEINQKFIFPQITRQPVFQQNPVKSIKDSLKQIPLLQTYFFYRRNKFYLKALIKKIKEVSPDVLLLQIDSNFMQIKELKKNFPDVLICTQINGSPFDEPFRNIAFKKYFEKQQKQAYTNSDLNFFISGFLLKRIMQEQMDPERDKVVHNGTNIEKFKPLKNKKELREKLGYPKDHFIIGYVGTLDYHKKMNLLLEVMKSLEKDYPKVKLVILGDGAAFYDLKKQIFDFNLENLVELKGWVDHHLINEHLNCFDVAVHHHANDYMSPLKIFEYLSAGIPVIGPDIPSIREIFSDKDELLLTKPVKADIYENLLKIIENKPEIQGLPLRGMKLIQEKYTWYHYTSEIIGIIEKKRKLKLT